MQSKKPLSYIEISKNNLIKNIKFFRKLLDPKTKLMAVIKANAYGHGDTEVVKILNPHVNYFQVNSVEELERARALTKKPILVLGYVQKSDFKKALELGGIVSVFGIHHMRELDSVAKKLGKKPARPNGHSGRPKVHIAIDAHLGREGFLPSNIEKHIVEIKKMKSLVVDGVYAHFANIEDTTDLSHAQKQIDAYEKVLKIFHENGFTKIKTHISATSGILAYEKWKGIHDIARLGVGLYGMWPSTELEKSWKKKITLKPVVRHVTHIAQVKDLPKGHTVGYGLTYKAKEDIKIAVIPQGYADGVVRALSSKGVALVRGKRAPIIGRVMMNMLVLDVSHIKGVKALDEVVLLGKQKGEEITAEEIAKLSGTINYEVTTRLSPLLPRIIG